MYIALIIRACIELTIVTGACDRQARESLTGAGGPPRGFSGRHRPNGYLASWVPSAPGKHTFKNFTTQTHPKTAGRKKTGYPLG